VGLRRTGTGTAARKLLVFFLLGRSPRSSLAPQSAHIARVVIKLARRRQLRPGSLCMGLGSLGARALQAAAAGEHTSAAPPAHAAAAAAS
jgi:hypothetical protein